MAVFCVRLVGGSGNGLFREMDTDKYTDRGLAVHSRATENSIHPSRVLAKPSRRGGGGGGLGASGTDPNRPKKLERKGTSCFASFALHI